MRFVRPTLAVTGSVAALLLAVACGSSSSTTASSPATHSASATAPASMSGTETFDGTLSGAAAAKSGTPVVPIAATGVFTDHGTIALTGNGPSAGQATLVLSRGKIYVHHTKGTTAQGYVKATCTGSQTNVVTYTVTGGSGAYAGAAGATGHATVTFAFTAKLASGKCNGAKNAPPTAVSIHFHAVGPITIK